MFASRYMAEYFLKQGHEIFVLNRNSRPQIDGVTLINCDRSALGEILKPYHFDEVIDVTAYNRSDVEHLLRALGSFDNYVMVSSSAVYPETLTQPFHEQQPCGANSYWGDYGVDKIAAERYLLKKVPHAYIVRPPYLYGRMNNLYREAFVFECAQKDIPFYVPKDGQMPLQFFDIEDMCRLIERLIDVKPVQHIFNVGNPETVSVCEWVTLCYNVLDKTPVFRYVTDGVPQRSYFPFLDYGYVLDVTEQRKIMPDTKPMTVGLSESYEWYRDNCELVRRKPLIEFIENHLRSIR